MKHVKITSFCDSNVINVSWCDYIFAEHDWNFLNFKVFLKSELSFLLQSESFIFFLLNSFWIQSFDDLGQRDVDLCSTHKTNVITQRTFSIVPYSLNDTALAI